jgi:Linalool dehydratase/isomerase
MSHPSPIREIPDSLAPPFAWKQEAPETPRAARAEPRVPSGEMDLRSGSKGPVTASRHRRNAVLYGLLCLLAFLPMLLQMSAGWQAFGLGLLMPGAGFLAVGGWAVLLFPLTVGVFWLSVVAWFWAGMVVAPITVWLGSAVLAGAMVGHAIWGPAAFLAPLFAAATFGVFQYRGMRKRAADQERLEMRKGFFATSLAEVGERVASSAAEGERELTPDQLAALRYVLDRALQPVGQYQGYDIIDQFQPAALRYQINHLGFALGLARCHYAPSFQGYLDQAQRNLVETYLARKVWSYWVYESMWGHFNFIDFDPARKSNIMLTGWYGMHVGQYLLTSGDRRYEEPGGLTFRLNQRTAYRHDYHTVIQSVVDNFERSDFCLFPCEPNWVYPVCNMYGMSALAVHDRLYGTTYVKDLLPKWLDMLDKEFTDGKGSLYGLRSYWTGLAMPFYSGEAGFAFFANVFSPELGRRLWAIGRKELGFFITKDGEGKPRLSLPREALSLLDKIDPGNYRPGSLFAYVAILMSAREFGDDELAEAALRSMDQDCGFSRNGVACYAKGSNLANVWGVEGRLMRTGDFRKSFVVGPPESVLTGPILTGARYPDVLVARAISDGNGLDLVLYPGAASGPQKIVIERLKPGANYELRGAREATFRADDRGVASFEVELRGRTPLHLEARG